MATEENKVPSSVTISRQLDQEKIDFLTKRVDELLKSNNLLRSSASKNEKDTHDIVLYFQREMELKDEIIARLNEELVKKATQLKFEVEKLKKMYEGQISTLKQEAEETRMALSANCANLDSELRAVESFRKEKMLHDGNVKHLQSTIEQQKQQLIDVLDKQERKFLEEKAHMIKDIDDQKAAFRDIALKEARLAMGEEARRILADNDRMFEEIKFHQTMSYDLEASKTDLASKLAVARRDIAIYAEKELEYAKQAHFKTKELKEVRDRIEFLEKQYAVAQERFKQRTKELTSSTKNDLEEASMDAVGLRRLLKIKNKELRHMKELAATIITQRSETEQFFLESLAEVKEIIKFEKKNGNRKVSTAKKGAASKTGFPPLTGKSGSAGHGQADIFDGDKIKVTLQDLTWDDKELVLRVLFAKKLPFPKLRFCFSNCLPTKAI